MELVKTLWKAEDKKDFLDYLTSLSNTKNIDWARRILNTQLDLLCLPTKKVHEIENHIYKGNYTSFLDLNIFDNYESIAIYGMILSKINDFDLMITYMKRYMDVMENWAHVDLLSFNIHDSNKNQFIALSNTCLKDSRIFVRRLGLMILFQMIDDPSVLNIIFESLIYLDQEDAYYVIMMGGWLLSEAIIKYKDKTLLFLSKHPDLNKKIVNKGIQKCRESRRLSQEEKDFLLAFKRK